MNLSDKEKKEYENLDHFINELKEWETDTFNYWKKRVEEYPEAAGRALKTAIDEFNDHADELEEGKDSIYNQVEKNKTGEHIDRLNSLISKLETLLKPGNRDKLSGSMDWMRPLWKNIQKVDVTTDQEQANNEVIKLFNEVYNNFEEEFKPRETLKTQFISGATLTNKSIALGIMFILKKRDGIEIKEYTTITKKFQSLGML